MGWFFFFGFFLRLLSLLADAKLICFHGLLENPHPAGSSMIEAETSSTGGGGQEGWWDGNGEGSFEEEAIMFQKTAAPGTASPQSDQ